MINGLAADKSLERFVALAKLAKLKQRRENRSERWFGKFGQKDKWNFRLSSA